MRLTLLMLTTITWHNMEVYCDYHSSTDIVRGKFWIRMRKVETKTKHFCYSFTNRLHHDQQTAAHAFEASAAAYSSYPSMAGKTHTHKKLFLSKNFYQTNQSNDLWETSLAEMVGTNQRETLFGHSKRPVARKFLSKVFRRLDTTFNYSRKPKNFKDKKLFIITSLSLH